MNAKKSSHAPFIDGRFYNLNGSSGVPSLPDLYRLFRWKLFHKSRQKTAQSSSLKVHHAPSPPQTDRDYLIWLGHASFLLQTGGKKILIDPCLTHPPFCPRYTPLPFGIDTIVPDYILISHGHYDHLDARTLTHYKGTTLLTPLRMTTILQKIDPSFTVLEADWFDKYAIEESFDIHFLPARHWHRRTLTDTNRVLWGSFLIKTPSCTLYFAGDTGYGEHFSLIGAQFPAIDLALLPIGAYAPRWFMKPIHMNPSDALQAFRDLGAKTLLPMHYGTFVLSDEPLNEPPMLLEKEKSEEDIHFVQIGKPLFLTS